MLCAIGGQRALPERVSSSEGLAAPPICGSGLLDDAYPTHPGAVATFCLYAASSLRIIASSPLIARSRMTKSVTQDASRSGTFAERD